MHSMFDYHIYHMRICIKKCQGCSRPRKAWDATRRKARVAASYFCEPEQLPGTYRDPASRKYGTKEYLI